MKTLPNIYLAGAMENAEDGILGSTYRDGWSAWLHYHFNVNILNPCEFEPLQLPNDKFRPTRLPESFEARDGSIIRPRHWHELKLAPRKSPLYKRFKKYMRRIINYDCRLVDGRVDYVLANWNEDTQLGGGTHAECTIAYRSNIPVYTLVDPKIDMTLSGWVEGCSSYVYTDFMEMFEDLKEELERRTR